MAAIYLNIASDASSPSQDSILEGGLLKTSCSKLAILAQNSLRNFENVRAENSCPLYSDIGGKSSVQRKKVGSRRNSVSKALYYALLDNMEWS